eukprot:1148818-Prorocentrum_minimum.AAC.1
MHTYLSQEQQRQRFRPSKGGLQGVYRESTGGLQDPFPKKPQNQGRVIFFGGEFPYEGYNVSLFLPAREPREVSFSSPPIARSAPPHPSDPRPPPPGGSIQPATSARTAASIPPPPTEPPQNSSEPLT